MTPRQLTSALLRATVCALAMVTPELGSSHELTDPPVAFGGFGTLGATYQNTPGLEYRRSTIQARGTRAAQVDLGTDSVLGLEAHSTLGSGVRLLAEGVSSRDENNRWTPRLERALVAFTPDESWEIRAGRIGFDSYPLAESPAVGFTYLPIRPAPEMFGLYVTDHFDGLDATARTSVDDGVASVRVLAGHGDGNVSFANGTHAANDAVFLGGQVGYTWGPWLGRLGYVRVIADDIANSKALTQSLAATGVPQSLSLARRLDRTNHGTNGIQLGVAYDGRPLQMQILLTRIDSTVATGPRVDVGLLTVGYEVAQNVTPYVSYADARPLGTVLPTGLPQTPQFAELNAAALGAQLASYTDQRTLSIGTRLDISHHFDLKMQVDYVQAHDSALLFNTTATPHSATRLLLFGAALDFVF